MIPNIFHFIYFTPDAAPDKDFSLSYYIAIKSALEINKPDKIYFHCNRELVGEWWDAIKPHLTINKTTSPDSFMGKPLVHYAHKADVVRLQVLKQIGGIYMDLDTICVKPLTEFRDNEFVIGTELKAPYTPKNKRQEIKLKIKKALGLVKEYKEETIFCNAILMAAPNSKFIDLWINTYKTFRSKGRDKYWIEHSSAVPTRLAKENPELITILGPYTFHYPLYTKAGLQSMFAEVNAFPKAYAHHLFDSFSQKEYLSKLSIEYIRTVDTTYNILARKIL